MLYGYAWGLWLAFYFHFCLRDIILHHIEQICLKKRNEELPYRMYITFSTLMFVLVMMSQIITYIAVDASFDPPDQWLKNIAEKCNKDLSKDKQILNYKSVVYSGVPITSYGCYLGLLIHRFLFGQLWPKIYKTNISKFLARYLVIGFIALPSVLVFVFLPWTADLTILIIFKTLLPCFICGLLIFGFSHFFFIKLRLLNDQEQDSYNLRSSLNSQNYNNQEQENFV